MNHIKNAFLTLLYPSHCLHCDESTLSTHFCETCASHLEVIDPENRCPKCFKIHSGKCKERTLLKRKAAVFEKIGPSLTLCRRLKIHPYLNKGAAAYLAMQWDRLSWPNFDLIVPAPIPLNQTMIQGFDHNTLMAKALSKLLKIPSKRALYYPLNEKAPQLKRFRKKALSEKSLLLISDGHGNSLEAAAYALYEARPREIYGLSLTEHRTQKVNAEG